MADVDPIEMEERIRNSVPRIDDETGSWFVVERDLLIASDELQNYCVQKLTPPSVTDESQARVAELTAATIDGKPMRWKCGASILNLTWSVVTATFPESKPEWAERAADYAREAGEEWNDVASSNNLPIRFTEVADGSSVFKVRYEQLARGTYAVAFFPNQQVAGRTIRVGPAMFAERAKFDPVGVLRHELGHVLGFRHEHIRPESPDRIEPWIVGAIGAADLTAYDNKSVMHYPLSPGHGTNDFRITDFDKAGFVSLYQMPTEKVREFDL